MKSPPLIAPSLLAGDLARLGEELRAACAAGGDMIHLDVMDGRFVPNLTFGAPVISALKRFSSKPFDVHLMVEERDGLIERYLDAGADILTLHAESIRHLDRSVRLIRKLGGKAGVALNPATPPEAVRWLLDDIDQVIVMTVNPGFAGQKLLPYAEAKIKAVRALIGKRNVRVSADGGVTKANAGLLTKAGADVLVAGASVFASKDYRQAISALRAAATASGTAAGDG